MGIYSSVFDCRIVRHRRNVTQKRKWLGETFGAVGDASRDMNEAVIVLADEQFLQMLKGWALGPHIPEDKLYHPD